MKTKMQANKQNSVCACACAEPAHETILLRNAKIVRDSAHLARSDGVGQLSKNWKRLGLQFSCLVLLHFRDMSLLIKY